MQWIVLLSVPGLWIEQAQTSGIVRIWNPGREAVKLIRFGKPDHMFDDIGIFSLIQS